MGRPVEVLLACICLKQRNRDNILQSKSCLWTAACRVIACQHHLSCVQQSLAVQTTALVKLHSEPSKGLCQNRRDRTLICSHLAADMGLCGAHQAGKGRQPVWPECSWIDGVGHSDRHVIASTQPARQRDSLEATVALNHSAMSARMSQFALSTRARQFLHLIQRRMRICGWTLSAEVAGPGGKPSRSGG